MVVLLGVLVNMDRGFSLQGKKISLLMRTVDVRFVTLLLFVHFCHCWLAVYLSGT
jgi:hypothetical protein